MVSTFIGIYSEIFGLSGVEVGVIGSAYSLTQVVILYPIGRFADLGKRKILLLAGLILGVPTYIAFWQVTGFATLFGARLLQGTTIALTTAIGLSFISIRSEGEHRGRNIGAYNSLRAAGQTIGALGGGFLVANFGFGVPYMGLASLYGISLLLVYYLVPPESREEREDRPGGGLHLSGLLSGKQFKIQMAFELGFAFAKSIVIIFIPVYAYAVVGVSEMQLGAIVAARYLAFAVGQVPGGKLSDVVGRVPLVISGGILFALGGLSCPRRPRFWG